jgi:DNA-binding transcriptional ArsR family regulator
MIRWNDGMSMGKEKVAGQHHHHPARAWPKLPQGGHLDDASAMFRALGEPSRLRLLARLADGEICVSELAELEDENITTVSARLKTLYAVRLVKRRREAKHIYYALWDDHVLKLVNSAVEHAAERK